MKEQERARVIKHVKTETTFGHWKRHIDSLIGPMISTFELENLSQLELPTARVCSFVNVLSVVCSIQPRPYLNASNIVVVMIRMYFLSNFCLAWFLEAPNCRFLSLLALHWHSDRARRFDLNNKLHFQTNKLTSHSHFELSGRLGKNSFLNRAFDHAHFNLIRFDLRPQSNSLSRYNLFW